MTLTDRFVRSCETYCAQAGIPLRALAYRAVRNSYLFDRIERTGRLTVDVYERVLRYMAEHPVPSGLGVGDASVAQTAVGGTANDSESFHVQAAAAGLA